MANDADIVEQLERFGLTETEAAAYLALVSRGRATPSELAIEADISTSYAYQIAKRLESEGLAIVEDHQTPTTIVAQPPTESLQSRMEQMEQTLSTIQDRFSQPKMGAGSLRTHRSRETALKCLRNQIENAESELFLSLPCKTMLDVTAALRNAVDRGVFVLLVVVAGMGGISETNLEGVATAVRRRGWETDVYLVTDTSRGLLAPCSLFDWSHGDCEAVSFDDTTIAVALERAFFGTIWCNSQEILLRRPPEEPRTYRALRPAIYHGSIRERSGQTIEAKVRAYPTLPEETSTGSSDNRALGGDRPEQIMTGTILETHQNFVNPTTSDFATEHGLVLETDEDRITISGRGSFWGDYIAEFITLTEV